MIFPKSFFLNDQKISIKSIVFSLPTGYYEQKKICRDAYIAKLALKVLKSK